MTSQMDLIKPAEHALAITPADNVAIGTAATNEITFNFDLGAATGDDILFNFDLGVASASDIVFNDDLGAATTNDITFNFDFGTVSSNDLTFNFDFGTVSSNDLTFNFDFGTASSNDITFNHDFGAVSSNDITFNHDFGAATANDITFNTYLGTATASDITFNDDFGTGTDIRFSGTDPYYIVSTATIDFSTLVAGDIVTVIGSTSNDGNYTVTGTPTSSQVQVTEAVTPEDLGDTISVLANLAATTDKITSAADLDFSVLVAGDTITITGAVTNNGIFTVSGTPTTTTVEVVEALVSGRDTNTELFVYDGAADPDFITSATDFDFSVLVAGDSVTIASSTSNDGTYTVSGTPSVTSFEVAEALVSGRETGTPTFVADPVGDDFITSDLDLDFSVLATGDSITIASSTSNDGTYTVTGTPSVTSFTVAEELVTGTDSAALTIVGDPVADDFITSAADMDFSALLAGDLVTITGSTSNNSTFTVTGSPTASSFTVAEALVTGTDVATPLIVGDTVGDDIIQSAGDIDFSVLSAGDIVTITGSTSNNGTFTVTGTPTTAIISVAEALTTGKDVATPAVVADTVGDDIIQSAADVDFSVLSAGDSITIATSTSNDGTYTVTGTPTITTVSVAEALVTGTDVATPTIVGDTVGDDIIQSAGDIDFSVLSVGDSLVVASSTSNDGTYTVTGTPTTNRVAVAEALVTGQDAALVAFTSSPVGNDRIVSTADIDFSVLSAGDEITIASSTSNDGTYTVAGVPTTTTLFVTGTLVAGTETGTPVFTGDPAGDDTIVSTADIDFSDLSAGDILTITSSTANNGAYTVSGVPTTTTVSVEEALVSGRDSSTPTFVADTAGDDIIVSSNIANVDFSSLKAGDKLTITTSTSNNGTYTVTGRSSATRVSVAEALVTGLDPLLVAFTVIGETHGLISDRCVDILTAGAGVLKVLMKDVNDDLIVVTFTTVNGEILHIKPNTVISTGTTATGIFELY